MEAESDSDFEEAEDGTVIKPHAVEQVDEKIVRLNRAIILQGISKVYIDKRDTIELDKQFHKVTHLHLQNKNIDVLDSLHLFPNLTVLYLYDNNITEITGLETVSHLELLYLQKNKLDRINGLLQCRKLRKLFLGHNEISVIEGLDQLAELEELHVECQHLPPGDELLFDPSTLDVLSTCLRVLNISGNRIQSLEDFSGFQELVTLTASDNSVSDLDNSSLILSTLPNLRVLDLRGNPITKYHKYKEKLIGFGGNLELLDNKVVTPVTRQFIQKFCRMKSSHFRMMVNSYGGSPGADPGSSVMTRHPSPFPFPRTAIREPAGRGSPGMEQPKKTNVEHILSRLYPKGAAPRLGTDSSELQQDVDALLKASGDVRSLLRPQEISIPQFVLASSSTFKSELGLISKDEEEEARAVTRGATPLATQSAFDLDFPDPLFQEDFRSAGSLDSIPKAKKKPAKSAPSFTVLPNTRERAHYAVRERYEKEINSSPRITEMTKSLLRHGRTPMPIKRTSLSQLKGPPSMTSFKGAGSEAELGRLSRLSLQGQTLSATQLKGSENSLHAKSMGNSGLTVMTSGGLQSGPGVAGTSGTAIEQAQGEWMALANEVGSDPAFYQGQADSWGFEPPGTDVHLPAYMTQPERDYGPNGQRDQSLSWLHQQQILGPGHPAPFPSQHVQPKKSLSAPLKKGGSGDGSPQPYQTQVYELPPWPHILRNVGALHPKVNFMP